MIYNSGKLYVGGSFTQIGNAPRRSFGAYDLLGTIPPVAPNSGNYTNIFASPLPLLDSIGLSAPVVTETASDFAMELYPNPATDHVQIKLSTNPNASVSVQITDLQGTVFSQLQQSATASGSLELAVPLVNMPRGLYVVRIVANGYLQTSRLIVK